MENFQTQKNALRVFHQALDAAKPGAHDRVLWNATTPDYLWRGFHPFDELQGPESVAETFWDPLKAALSSLQRREDIFFAGRNQIDDFASVWVVSMGHFLGLFDAPWLGLRPTGKLAMLRYCSFDQIIDGQVAQTALYVDIPHFAAQTGQGLFPKQTAAHLVQPGPMTHDGLLYAVQPEAEGRKTLNLINAMIADLGQWQSGLPLEEELRRTWGEEMLWWGPEGIGATYTIPRYAEQHARPFRAGFSERSHTSHIARLAEGSYGGFFGWPNFTARPTGGFMGLPGSESEGEFRVIDIYRRAGDKLAENWIFIDLLHFWKTQGVDFLAEAAKRRRAAE
ncbi:MAG: nuclear transport factor 2 family protein [Dinoroseobacter sp.]|nr:nuclear transport factor 2 family protein [Dinoroseobacter sp.]